MLLLLLRRFFYLQEKFWLFPFLLFIKEFRMSGFCFWDEEKICFFSISLSLLHCFDPQAKERFLFRLRTETMPFSSNHHHSAPFLLPHWKIDSWQVSSTLSLRWEWHLLSLSLSLLVLFSLLVRQLSYFRPMLGCQIRKPVKQWI